MDLCWPESDQCSGQFLSGWSSVNYALVSFPQADQALTILWLVSLRLVKCWPCTGQFPSDWLTYVMLALTDHFIINPLSTWWCLIGCWSHVISLRSLIILWLFCWWQTTVNSRGTEFQMIGHVKNQWKMAVFKPKNYWNPTMEHPEFQ